MKSKFWVLFTILVLLSACFKPETDPPILPGEQHFVIEDGTYCYNDTGTDTVLDFHLDYYISRDSCVRGNFSIQWENGVNIYVNIDYFSSIVEHAGTWYEWNGIVPVNTSLVDSGGVPTITIEGYNGDNLVTGSIALELVTSNQ